MTDRDEPTPNTSKAISVFGAALDDLLLGSTAVQNAVPSVVDSSPRRRLTNEEATGATLDCSDEGNFDECTDDEDNETMDYTAEHTTDYTADYTTDYTAEHTTDYTADYTTDYTVEHTTDYFEASDEDTFDGDSDSDGDGRREGTIRTRSCFDTIECIPLSYETNLTDSCEESVQSDGESISTFIYDRQSLVGKRHLEEHVKDEESTPYIENLSKLYRSGKLRTVLTAATANNRNEHATEVIPASATEVIPASATEVNPASAVKKTVLIKDQDPQLQHKISKNRGWFVFDRSLKLEKRRAVQNPATADRSSRIGKGKKPRKTISGGGNLTKQPQIQRVKSTPFDRIKTSTPSNAKSTRKGALKTTKMERKDDVVSRWSSIVNAPSTTSLQSRPNFPLHDLIGTAIEDAQQTEESKLGNLEGFEIRSVHVKRFEM